MLRSRILALPGQTLPRSGAVPSGTYRSIGCAEKKAVGKQAVPTGAVSTLDADDAPQGVDDFHQIHLRGHDSIDVLVRHGRFIDDACILAAFDTRRCCGMLVDGKPAFGLAARHATAGAMGARLKAFRVALAAHDIGFGAHRTGNDAKVPGTRPHRTLASDPDGLAEM